MSKAQRNLAPPSYGEVWPGQGGIVVDFVPGQGGKPGWYLIAAIGPEGEKENIAWGGRDVDEPGAQDQWDGLSNTIALVGSKTDHPIATWARSLVIDGHRDFYIPSIREMRLLWARTPELFQPRWYWSSTQFSRYGAWFQLFNYGYQDNVVKSYEGRVRAVRRLVIQ